MMVFMALHDLAFLSNFISFYTFLYPFISDTLNFFTFQTHQSWTFLCIHYFTCLGGFPQTFAGCFTKGIFSMRI